MNILVVDDHMLIREGVRLLLERMPEVESVCEAEDGTEAMRWLYKNHPDIVIMDLSMPAGIDGFTAAQHIMGVNDQTKIIILTMHDQEAYIRRAIHLKVAGYLLKNSEPSLIRQAVLAVDRGETFFDPAIPREMIERHAKSEKDSSVLTKREQEVLGLVSVGYSNRQIAEKLTISTKTVERHKENMMKKLELKGQHELVQYGLRNNYGIFL